MTKGYEKRVLAIDFGASSGRVMLGTYNGETIKIEEIHRFSNDPVLLNKTMYWDFLRLFHEIKQGLIKAKKYMPIDSVGVDTWGVDFGLLDKEGNLLDNPIHYRDKRTEGMLEKSFEKIPKEQFYQLTGNQFMEINTVFQLLSLVEQKQLVLERAHTMLFIPDLFNYFLSGVACSEYSIASTSQLLDAKEKNWSADIVESLAIPKKILPNIIPSGTKLGKIKPDICEELGLDPIEVIAVAGHDTQSALVAVPAKEEDFIFISCGTWSLFGTELDSPIINEQSAALNVTNEGGYGGKISFLKNIIGLWLIQESRRQWIREGKEYGFGHLEQMAARAEAFQSFIDPDMPEFISAGNIPGRIQTFCKETNQVIPKTEGEIVRCINESLALKYRIVLEQLKQCTGKEYKVIHMVGGGTQSKLLCQMTANACGCPVVAGPVEATVFGNFAVQLIAMGEIKDLKEARQIITNSEEVITYLPKETEQWEEAYKLFCKITKL